MTSGHRQIDHTADVAFELWAPDEAELLVEGARAVVEVLTGESTGGVAGHSVESRRVVLSALDPEDRLVQWLNEIIVLAVLEGFVFESADVTLEGEGGLEAKIVGVTDPSRVITELKSATYHDLVLERSGGRAFARVVLDV
ncbi:MAG: archease [Deltaproteobacteria bacterium]|nr:archease [Deltaproteobacteria bacterium]